MTVPPESLHHDATGAGQAGSVECGAVVRLEVELRDGFIRDAHYQAYGCPATLGCIQKLTESVRDMSFLEAALVSDSALMAAVPVASGRLDAAALAIDALHGALTQVLASEAALTEPKVVCDPRGVLVGMSGGVDSAVAALLLRDQGYRVVGVTLQLSTDVDVPGERSCCSPETVRRARRVAHSLGIPHFTLELSELFADQVVRYFVDSYQRGITPNPCAKCNARVRFAAMLELAKRLGLHSVATGHYARLTGEPPRLARGSDHSKDQSYVLAEVAPEILERVVFPLGELVKPQVRALAAAAGLEGHEAPESQEICFVADDDHRRFLRERLGDIPGDIVDSAGLRLGEHAGVYNYTIGQRKGLGLSGPEPRYVLRLDAETRRVIVGDRSQLRTCGLSVNELTWHRALPSRRVAVKIRSSGDALSALVEQRGWEADLKVGDEGGGSNSIALRLDLPATAVAVGQTAVVYDEDAVVVAGTITAADPCNG